VCGHALATQRHCEPLSELRCAHTCAFTIARFPHVASDILPCDMLVVCVCVCVCCARTRARTTLTTMQKAMHACMQRYTQRDTLHVVLTSVLLLVDQYEYGQEPPGAHTSPFKRARFAPRICRLASSIGTGLTPGSGGATCMVPLAWTDKTPCTDVAKCPDVVCVDSQVRGGPTNLQLTQPHTVVLTCSSAATFSLLPHHPPTQRP
jgi:hypothetical protein